MKNSMVPFAAIALCMVFMLTACTKDDLQYALVTKVVIKEFPATRANGTAWDNNATKADIYIRIVDLTTLNTGSNTVIYEYPGFVQGADPFNSNEFGGIQDVRLLPTVKYRLALRDEDDGVNPKTNTEAMGSIDFTIPESSKKDKTENPILLSGDGITAEVYVEYVY